MAAEAYAAPVAAAAGDKEGGAAAAATKGTFKEKVNFSNAEQFGSRAVGGHKPHDEKAYSNIQSSDYLTPDTKHEEAYQRTFTPHMRNRRRLFIWMLYAWLGLSVGVAILVVLGACDLIQKKRVKATQKALAEDDVLMAWVWWTGSSMVLCLGASVLVLWQPAAASSGIPALIAYLNGVLPHGGKSPLTGKATGFRSAATLFAKTIGMILSIPSGLALGPEGPIIHISALLGHHTCRIVQTLSHNFLPERFHFTVKAGEGRDFLATGAACGICVAFRAPLGGCLFVVEEAASFFTTEHLEYTFFATIISYMVAWALANPDDGFTKFKQPTGYWCTNYDGFDMALFVFIAIVGGVLGALFNQIVEHLNHLRGHHINKSALKRVAEVVMLVLVTGTVTVFLPMAFSCKHPSRELLMQDSIGCLSEEDAFQISHGTVSHTVLSEVVGQNPLLMTDAQTAMASKLEAHRVEQDMRVDDDAENAWKDVVWLDNTNDNKTIHLHYQHSYTCNSSDYNEMSMLWLNGGVKGVKVLMQRGFPHVISWEVLIVFFCVYFCLAAYTSGVSVPAGLIVPMLLLGGSYGRATGLLGIAVKKEMCMSGEMEGLSGDITDTYFWSTVYRWIGRDCRLPDPGMYAVVGMAAFLGGSGRITMMLATVIVELTDDASLIAPVGVASIISMIVGNLFNHGLYHGLIPVQNLPFMNSEPADVMWIVSVVDIMSKEVVALSKSVKPKDIHELVQRCEKGEITHNAFPVVDCASTNRRLRGIVSLDQLKQAASGGNVLSTNSGTVKAQGHSRGFSMANLAGKINLLDYADRSPIITYENASFCAILY